MAGSFTADDNNCDRRENIPNIYQKFGDPNKLDVGCTIDGMSATCKEALRMVNAGAATVASVSLDALSGGANNLSLSSATWIEDVDQRDLGSSYSQNPEGVWSATVNIGMSFNGHFELIGNSVPTGTMTPLLPQKPIRNVGPILDKVRYLGDKVNDPNLKSMLQVRLMQLLSKGCADAFKRAGLSTPEEIINKGITIASRPLLDDPSNNETLGLSESTRQGFSERSKADALTIRSQFTSKGPIIFFRAEAFADLDYLDEAIAHEFIHAAGVGQFPLWGYRLGRGNDLSGYEHYQDIIDNCGYQNVSH